MLHEGLCQHDHVRTGYIHLSNPIPLYPCLCTERNRTRQISDKRSESNNFDRRKSTFLKLRDSRNINEERFAVVYSTQHTGRILVCVSTTHIESYFDLIICFLSDKRWLVCIAKDAGDTWEIEPAELRRQIGRPETLITQPGQQPTAKKPTAFLTPKMRERVLFTFLNFYSFFFR